MLPPEDDFPYTVRINSEVMASDGSTSMASVCGGTLFTATVVISNLLLYITIYFLENLFLVYFLLNTEILYDFCFTFCISMSCLFI